jgi:hypothetical protein
MQFVMQMRQVLGAHFQPAMEWVSGQRETKLQPIVAQSLEDRVMSGQDIRYGTPENPGITELAAHNQISAAEVTQFYDKMEKYSQVFRNNNYGLEGMKEIDKYAELSNIPGREDRRLDMKREWMDWMQKNPRADAVVAREARDKIIDRNAVASARTTELGASVPQGFSRTELSSGDTKQMLDKIEKQVKGVTSDPSMSTRDKREQLIMLSNWKDLLMKRGK